MSTQNTQLLNYYIKIDFGRQVPDPFSLGTLQYTDAWTLGTSAGTFNGYNWREGFLTLNRPSISNTIDILDSGTFNNNTTRFAFQLSNVDTASTFPVTTLYGDVIRAYDIQLEGTGVEVYLFGEDEPIFKGEIGDFSVTDTTIDINCVRTQSKYHKNFLYKNFTRVDFPQLNKSYIDKPIPECFGEVARAKLVPISDSREIVTGVFSEYKVNDNSIESADVTPVKTVGVDGSFVVVFRGWDSPASDWYDKTGMYVDVLKGQGSGESRKIVANYLLTAPSAFTVSYYNIFSDGTLSDTTTNSNTYQYEVFELEKPLDLLTLEPFKIDREALELMKAGTQGTLFNMTELGFNTSRFLNGHIADPDNYVLKGWDDSYNRQYTTPWHGEIQTSSAPDNFTETSRFGTNEELKEYYKQTRYIGNYDTGQRLKFPILNSPNYMTVDPETSYICVAKHDATFVTSTSEVNAIANPTLLYQDDTLGEINISDTPLNYKTQGQNASNSEPRVVLDGSFSDKSATINISNTRLKPDVYLKHITCDTAHTVESTFNTLLDLGSDGTLSQSNSVKLLTIDGNSVDSDIDSKATIILNIPSVSIDNLDLFDNMLLGSRLRIEPNISDNDPTAPPVVGSDDALMTACRVSLNAIDYQDNIIRSENVAWASSIVEPTVESESNFNIVTKYRAGNGLTNGKYVFEGLPSSYYENTPDVVTDASHATSDFSDLLQDPNLTSIVKEFQIRYEVNLHAGADSSYPPFDDNANPWTIWLDAVGIQAEKEVNPTKLSVSSGGIRTREQAPTTDTNAPHRLLKQGFKQIDNFSDNDFVDANFTSDFDSYFNYTIGKQVNNQIVSLGEYNKICNQSMFAVWPRMSGSLGGSFWLRDSNLFGDVTPSVTFDTDDTVYGSLSMAPPLFDTVYTEYNCEYDFDPVSNVYKKEFHIRNTDANGFPSLEDWGPSEDLVTNTDPLVDTLPTIVIDQTYRWDGYVNAGLVDNGDNTYNAYVNSVPLGIGDTVLIWDFSNARSYRATIERIARGTGQNARFYFKVLDEYLSSFAPVGTLPLPSTFARIESSGAVALWKSYCNASSSTDNLTNYINSKELWQRVQTSRSLTNLLTSAPDDVVKCDWISDAVAFETYVNRLIYWNGFPKETPVFDIPLTKDNVDKVELLTYVRWVDPVYTTYVKYLLNGDGTSTGTGSNVTYRDGWVTGYTLDFGKGVIRVQLVLDSESTEDLVIDENTTGSTETYDENTNSPTDLTIEEN